tara:strand:- start:1600 stop:2775 length:1176 start_codon:yes stop_codon:yes gene_type:complete
VQQKKITIIANKSKIEGGANIAAIRIANILKKNFSINVIYPNKNFTHFLKNIISKIFIKLFIGKTDFLNSLNIFDNINTNQLKNEILNLHWIGKETISLDTLIKKKINIIWTLHDMWPITSTEHFVYNPKIKKYSEKNLKKNFLKKKIYIKKKELFSSKKVILITCCKWLENIAKRSDNTRKLYIKTIYNPIEIEIWKRKNQILSKKKLKLDLKKKYILFGAHGGLSNPRKGGDLLIKNIDKINDFLIKNNYEIIVLGGKRNYIEKYNGVNFNFRKHETSKEKQVFYHSAVDLTLSYSRAEALPQFLVETILCKNPVVSFNVGGIKEIVTHKKNGYLVDPFDIDSFSRGIKFVIENKKNLSLKRNINFIKKEFSAKNVMKKYNEAIKKFTR